MCQTKQSLSQPRADVASCPRDSNGGRDEDQNYRAVSAYDQASFASIFTGSVFSGRNNCRRAAVELRAFRVTFAPGGATAWHTHTIGQTLKFCRESARIGWEVSLHGHSAGRHDCDPGGCPVIGTVADSNHLTSIWPLPKRTTGRGKTVWMEHVPEADYAKRRCSRIDVFPFVQRAPNAISPDNDIR